MNDDKLKQQKIQIWKEKLAALEKEYVSVMEQRGEASQMGDLSENGAYQMLTEQGEVLSARIGETKRIIKDLGGDPDSGKAQSESA
jgi:hypothetical protein